MSTPAPPGQISFDGSRTPLKATLFVLVCLAWLLPGLVGHDPWKPDEAVVFGAVYEMLHSVTSSSSSLRATCTSIVRRSTSGSPA